MILNDLTKLKNLKEMIDYGAENFAGRVFVEFKENGGITKKTYSQLKDSCDTFSVMLMKEGIHQAHTAIVGPTSYEWIVTFFGTANSGGAAVPLAPNETDEMNCRLIDFADVTVFAFDEKHRSLYELVKANVPGVRLFISLDNQGDGKDVMNFADLEKKYFPYKDENFGSPDSDALCAIVFTSGTTGFPKGVMSSHKNFVYSAGSVHVACPTTRMFCCLPIHHSFCFTGNITKSIVRGKTVCVNDSLTNLISDLQLYKPDSILAVPQLVKKIMFGAIKYASAHPEIPQEQAVRSFLGGNIIDIISGGAPLEAALNDKFNQTGILVLNGYGMTECSPVISNNAVGFFRHGSVGKPIPCMDVKIENGEILVKGPNVMLGYYKNPQATQEVFTEDGYLRTGDLGYFDEDGYLYITGRCKNLILLDNGENVSAEMLEAQFGNEPLVQEVICYNEGSSICAEVYLNKAFMAEKGITDPDKAMLELLERVNEKLATHQRISSYVIRELPFERTASSKIKRNSRSGLAQKRSITAPETECEKKVCAAVKDQLMLREVSVTDNFFALGGDSLGAIELAVSLNIPAQLIYDKPFLRSLARAIEESTKEKTENDIDANSIIAETAGKGEKGGNYHCALLTGATGFLGVHILRELTEKGVEVYCLIRDEQRFQNQVQYYFDDFDFTGVKRVIGDIEKENLGLGEKTYHALCEKVDTVFHVAANVHHAGDYSDLERTNVIGTKNVIAFAMRANAVLQHTSTVSVHGAGTVKQRYGKKILDESVLDIGQKYEDNVYIHSKFCAEQEVLAARLQGLRANIYRIGNLTWRSSDGKFQKNSADNGFLHRVHAMLKLGLLNENMDKFPTDFTPVDECAKGYVNLALTGAVNEIYHMYNPNFLATKEMFELLEVPYRFVSTQETVATVTANAADRDVHVYLFYLIISGRSRNIEMKNDFTVEKLRETGFLWSEPDRRYLTLSDSPERPKGHCLDFAPYQVIPMTKTGAVLNPIQKLTLGVMKDADLAENVLFSGEVSLYELGDYIQDKGCSKPLIITFGNALNNRSVSDLVARFEDGIVFCDIFGEPTTEDTQKALDLYIRQGCDSVIAVGGGSVLDAAKIIALRAANAGEDIDDICRIDSDCSRSVPFFAVPTTAGTGSEVTVFAVITDTDEQKKKPFVSDKFQPIAVALDPSLTVTVPKLNTAYTGIDALSHAVEAYISSFAFAFPEDKKTAAEAAKMIFGNLRTVCDNPSDLGARGKMQKAAYLAGLGFRRIGTGYVHAIAHRLGEYYHLPHGKAISAAFVPVLRHSLPWAEKALSELAVLCGIADRGNDSENTKGFIDALEALISDIGIDNSDVKVAEQDLTDIVMRAQDEAKLMGCPRPFSDNELRAIISSL
ncbi:MAG: iron-containing alcohol dehydrogenase [Acutalibacteraceae bacterium]